MALNWPKQRNKLEELKGQKASAKGQSPPQELEVGLHSRSYLLVFLLMGCWKDNQNYIEQWLKL